MVCLLALLVSTRYQWKSNVSTLTLVGNMPSKKLFLNWKHIICIYNLGLIIDQPMVGSGKAQNDRIMAPDSYVTNFLIIIREISMRGFSNGFAHIQKLRYMYKN